MASPADREQQWNSAIGQKIGDATVAIVVADSIAKDAALARTVQLLERDNVQFKTQTNIIGMEEVVENIISVPAISVVHNGPILVDEATIDMSLEVHDSMEDASSRNIESETGVEVSASAKFGFFGQGGSASTKISQKVKVGVSDTHKRASDYTSTMAIHVGMRQAPPPEGLQVLIDGLVASTKQAMDINQAILTGGAAGNSEG